jgi:hypothetical protein
MDYPLQDFPSIDSSWMSNTSWNRKLARDSRSLAIVLPPELQELHAVVVMRAQAAGSPALILSGSTARGRRTEISDLDYHLIGATISIRDLSRELDLHVVSEADLATDIRAGDDFVQWSLRFGLVVFDSGIVRDAHRLIANEHPWPNPVRKQKQALKSVELAHRFVETGDEDGALEQVRTALSLTARAYLLAVGEFPLSRAELPGQLETHGQPLLAAALNATIFKSPSLEELGEAVDQAQQLLRIYTNPDEGGIHIRAKKHVRVG